MSNNDISAEVDAIKAENAARVAEQRLRSQQKKDTRLENDLKKAKNMTASQIETIAGKMGYEIEPGHGKHGKHIVAQDGNQCALPDHGGGKGLATGTLRTIIDFLLEHRS